MVVLTERAIIVFEHRLVGSGGKAGRQQVAQPVLGSLGLDSLGLDTGIQHSIVCVDAEVHHASFKAIHEIEKSFVADTFNSVRASLVAEICHPLLQLIHNAPSRRNT